MVQLKTWKQSHLVKLTGGEGSLTYLWEKNQVKFITGFNVALEGKKKKHIEKATVTSPHGKCD